MDIEILHEVLRGGLTKIHEASAVLVGGHSIDDSEFKYGLSVTGTVHPDGVWTNQGGQPGDLLILTKPLGTGVISTALKQNKASSRSTKQIEASMTTLNRRTCEILQGGKVHACTDVTGFGLIGHACEMIEGTTLGMVLHADQIPCFAEALQYVEQGLVPGGLKRNRTFRSPMVEASPSISPHLLDILYDPQTSGGLLVAVPPDQSSALLHQMHDAGISDAVIIGELTALSRGQIHIQ
jgi:selenide,water dikinase